MPDITLQSISVIKDGGTEEGRLAIANGALAAVFVRVTAEETAGGEPEREGWFLEAGFGPCGSLMSVRPPVFASLDDAVAWVRRRLAAGFDPH